MPVVIQLGAISLKLFWMDIAHYKVFENCFFSQGGQWVNVSWTTRNKVLDMWNLNQNMNTSFKENVFENVGCHEHPYLLRPQWVQWLEHWTAQCSACVVCRLFPSPSLVAERLPVEYDTWPPIGWHHTFVIYWLEYRLRLPQSQWVVGSLSAGSPLSKAVQGDCEKVYLVCVNVVLDYYTLLLVWPYWELCTG